MLPICAWAGNDEGKETIVAAGFGYQAGDVSTITVKSYDPLSGEVLSDDTYELNVKDDGMAKGLPSQERIFAGGVGPGATDLSNFVLRVYDAQTGKFQWEGNLNLTPSDAGGSGRLVSTVAPRRAAVTKVTVVQSSIPQPSFLLRALDPVTGALVWEDEFSTGGKGRGHVERVANRVAGDDGGAAGSNHAFDFRIRMVEGDGRRILWEDQFAQGDVESQPQPESVEEQALALPIWPGLPDRQSLREWM